jgi:hypothetical protein
MVPVSKSVTQSALDALRRICGRGSGIDMGDPTGDEYIVISALNHAESVILACRQIFTNGSDEDYESARAAVEEYVIGPKAQRDTSEHDRA